MCAAELDRPSLARLNLSLDFDTCRSRSPRKYDRPDRAVGLCEQSRELEARKQIKEGVDRSRSEEHTSELQSLMRISYAVFCLKKKKHISITRSLHYSKHTQ